MNRPYLFKLLSFCCLLMSVAASGWCLGDQISGRIYDREGDKLFVRDRTGNKWEVAAGTLLVRFSPLVSKEQVQSLVRSHGLNFAFDHENLSGYYLLNYDERRDPLQVAGEIVQEPGVLDACPDTEIKLFGTSDTFYSKQWNLRKTRIDKAWDVTNGSSSVIIAIIDTGIDYLHEDLAGSKWSNPNETSDGRDNDADSLWFGHPLVDDLYGWDFKSGDNDPRPTSGVSDYHGTMVAGLASAVTDNGVGIAGIAGARGSAGARLMTIRGSVVAAHVSKGIEYAWRKGAKVINMSFGVWDDTSNAVAAELDSAEAHGVVVVAACGDGGYYAYPASHVAFPASYPSVLSVGATDSSDVIWEYSSMGPELDVVAPSGRSSGYECWTTDNDGGLADCNPTTCPGGCPPGNGKYYSLGNGTSAASPEVAGLAALLLSHMPGLSPAEVRQRLTDSAVDLGAAGADSVYGFGRIDAYRALTEWGTITGHVTWRPEDTADSTRYISGDLTIAAGDTLTIMPGTIIKIATDDDLHAGADTLKVEINVEGTLIADGTAAHPIVFESWHPTTTEDWVGFYCDSLSGGAVFDHCRISRAEYAIESYVPLEISNSEIDTCRYGAVNSKAGGATIQACQLIRPGTFGIYLGTATDTALVRGTTVDGATSTALHVQPNETALVRSSIFMNSYIGLYAGSAGEVAVDSSSYFYNNDTGIHFYGNAGVPLSIKNSFIGENTSAAILCAGSSPLLDTNVIGFNGGGIYCSYSSSPRIQGNSIQASGYGVTAVSSSNPDLGHLSPSGWQSPGYNNIAHTGGLYVVNSAGGTISAQNNCWDKNTGACAPSSSLFSGTVDRTSPICCTFDRWDDESIIEPQPSLYVYHRPSPPPATWKMPPTALVSIVPNPFNPTTTIHYNLATPGRVDVKV